MRCAAQVQQCALECDAKGLDHLFSAIVTSAIATGDQLNPLAAEDVKPLRQHRLTVVETAIQVCAQCVCGPERLRGQDHQDISGINCSMQALFGCFCRSCTEGQARHEPLALHRRVDAARSRPSARARCSMCGASSGS